MRLVTLFLLLFLLLVPARAQLETSQELPQISGAVQERTERLQSLEERLGTELSPEELIALRDEVRLLRREGALSLDPLLRRKQQIEADIGRLGAPPEEGEPEEDETITERRRALSRLLAQAEAAEAQIRLNLATADRIVAAIGEARRAAFTDELLARGPLLTSVPEWRAAGETFLEGADVAREGIRGWVRDMAEKGQLAPRLGLLGFAVVLAVALLVPVRRLTNRIIGKRIAGVEPFPSRRVLLAAARTAARVVPGLLGGFLLYVAFDLIGAIPPEIGPLARAIWLAFVAILLVDGAVVSIFAPELPRWRVAPLRTVSVIEVRSIAFAAIAVLMIDLVLRRRAEIFGTSPALDFIQEGVVAVFLGVLLLLLSRRSLWQADEDELRERRQPAVSQGLELAERPPGAPEQPVAAAPAPDADTGRRLQFWRRTRFFGHILGLTCVLAAALGYVNLGHYVSVRAFGLIGLFACVWALRALMREGVRAAGRQITPSVGQDEAAPSAQGDLLQSWIGIVIDLIAALVFLPFALRILGAEGSDVRGWVADAFFGFSIGNVEISLAKIFVGVGIFLGLLWITRLIQKTADTQLFPRSRIDQGVQNSLRTLIGYVGLIVAFFSGVSALGFNLSNLAIIAGALSVGIGFGLQSIVNNFVSGLILLFERPIKVGDWIVTGSGEGIVKRISVRSTEIETFDRSSVIVPNSELISSAVTNWTHKDRMGRLVIAVGVAYESDAAHVVRVLEDVARKSRDILSYPAPLVVFEDFGASSLDFTLRVYMRDIGESLSVRTRLRIAIHERFRAEGIEIPFPQRDLNIRGAAEEVLRRSASRFTEAEAAE